MNKIVDKGVYILSGSVEFSLISGDIESIGKKVAINEKIFVPEGKRIPIEVHQKAEIELSNEVDLVSLPARTIPEDWDETVKFIIENKIESLLIFGEVDTGKTFFSTYLTNKIISEISNFKVSVLDCDIGQSDIGPPGTLGIAVFKKPVLFMSECEPDMIYFVGSHSPSEHFLHYLTGFVKLVNFGRQNSDLVIIDTPGWVHGDGGRMLRRTEIELLDSLNVKYCIILLQRNDELEHLVKGLEDTKVLRLKVSKKASPTSASERKKLREFMYKKYFSSGKTIELSFNKISTDRGYFLTGNRLKNEEKIKEILWTEKLPSFEGIYIVSCETLDSKSIQYLNKKYNTKIKNVTLENFNNLVIGLLDKNFNTLGLGIIEKIDFSKMKIFVYTPIYNQIDKIKIIQFGSLKTSPEGEEKGFIIPGSV